MTEKERKQKAKEFAEYWKDKGYEKGQSQKFWLSFLRDILGVDKPEQIIEFEETVKEEHTKFIDGWIDSTKVLIEQKSSSVNLRLPIKQSDGSLLTPFQQALKYNNSRPYSKKARWIITCNFQEFLIYDMEKPNGEPESILLKDLPKECYRLQFIVEQKNELLHREEQISIKAGELVGILYEALLKQYDEKDEEELKSLNEFCVRIIFCLYAEDSGLFGEKLTFHNYINQIMNQLKAGAALNYVVILLNTAVGLLYTPYMLRMMGQSEYGLYSLVASVIAYLTVLDLGLGNAVIRYTAKFRAEGKTKEQYEMFGMFLALYSIISVVALIGGMGLYLNVDRMFGGTMTEIELSHARIMMLILVFNLVVTFPMSIFGSIMSAYERFVFPKVINIIRIILNTVVMIVLLEMGYKAIAMVIIQTLFNVATLVINYLYCKYRLQIKIQFAKIQWGFLREVAIYSFWIFLNVIMDRVYWSTGQFMLGIVAGTAAIAVFAVAIQLHTMYMQFSTAISSVFLPKVTGMVALRNNRAEISDLFIKTGRIQNIIMSMILFGFITFGRAFIALWAGPEYNDAYIIACLFFISLYIPLIQNLGITILQARNQMKFRSLLYIGIAAVALVLQYYFAKMWGGIGCAVAISGALFIGQGVIMNIYYKVKQGINISRFWKEIAQMNFAPFVLSACFLYIMYDTIIDSWSKLALWIFIYAIIYIALLCTVSMNQYERNLFIDPIKKILKR